MSSRVARLLGFGPASSLRMLDGFVDSLLQMFENCRPGVTDARLHEGPAALEGFFRELYEKEERSRLRETIDRLEQHLAAEARAELFRRVDQRIRNVVVPAYARIASPFTARERNDFYLVPDALHGAERLAWAVGGIALAAVVVRGPFPLWEKELVVPFALAGLFLPNLRRYLALRRYQADLNDIVRRADDEIWRMDLAYMTSGEGVSAGDVAATREPDATPPDSVELPPLETRPRPAKPTLKQGGR